MIDGEIQDILKDADSNGVINEFIALLLENQR